MANYSCLDCKNYCPKKEVVDGYREECGGMILVPKTKVVEHHCDVHPRVFKRWWKDNGHKPSSEVKTPKCIELHEHLKTLNEMIHLAREILDDINKKNGGEKLT